jgi:hypothetical protein
MGMDDLEAFAPQKSDQAQELVNASDRVHTARGIKFLDPEIRPFKPIEQRSFDPQTSQGHVVTPAIHATGQLNCLNLSSAKLQRVYEVENAANPTFPHRSSAQEA